MCAHNHSHCYHSCCCLPDYYYLVHLQEPTPMRLDLLEFFVGPRLVIQEQRHAYIHDPIISRREQHIRVGMVEVHHQLHEFK